MKKILFIILATLLLATTINAQEIKIGNITTIDGEHKNTLTGQGLLIGLNGTGDSNNVPKIKAELALHKNNGIVGITERDINSKNVAIVQVQGYLNPYVKVGQTIKLSVSSTGSAKSLKGGKLVPTLLHYPYLGKDIVYAIASGSIVVDTDHPNTGIVHAIVEAEVPVTYLHGKGKDKHFLLNLSVPNFSNANQIANDINLIHSNADENQEDSDDKERTFIAVAMDASTIKVTIPKKYSSNPIGFISNIQKIPITDYIEEAKIIVSQSNQTVIASSSVTMAPVAIAHKDLSIKILGQAGQAGQENRFVEVPASRTLKALTDSLNRLGVKPADLVQIITKLHSSGSIRAKLVIE